MPHLVRSYSAWRYGGATAGGSHGPVTNSLRSASSLVRPFGGGGQVGLDDREVGETVEGAPAAAGSPLLDLGRASRAAPAAASYASLASITSRSRALAACSAATSARRSSPQARQADRA